MLVYRTESRRLSGATLVAGLRDRAARIACGAVTHDAVVDLLVATGEAEAGIVDAIAPERDEPTELAALARAASLAAGRLLVASWAGEDAERLSAGVRALAAALEALARAPLPAEVELRTPEGYAYYALYPEAYVEAARALAAPARAHGAICIGIRSIGTSLSAAAAAALEREGCAVRSYTVRPHGHPFDRRLAIAPALAEEWRARHDALFLVVDEGPGLSGSSFTSVAAALSGLGVSDERIVLLPSWAPDGGRFVSAAARERWPRHRKIVVGFEPLWLGSGRLARAHGVAGDALADFSGGRWRARVYARGGDVPPTHPQHERRKYLARDLETGAARLLRFVGLGRRGEAKRARAERLAEVGFTPTPRTLAHGFLASDFVEGTPLRPGIADREMLETLARYLAFVAGTFPVGGGADVDGLREMVRVNVGEAFGPALAERAARAERWRAALGDAPAVALDGRMLPHEWLVSAEGLLKTDALDHHDDHFYPGCQDIAWDLAATIAEFELGGEAASFLVERYRALSGDRRVASRLPFHRVAYLAARLGYARLAADSLAGEADGARWRHAAARYGALLARELGESEGEGEVPRVA